MAKIIPLAEYKMQSALQAGFRTWRSLFDETLDAQTRLCDLSPKTLCYLAEPGDQSTTALYALIIGFSGFGNSVTFDELDSRTQTRVLDVFLFLSDQIRFEMMFRLGWIERLSGNQSSLFEMVTDFERIKRHCMEKPPELARGHKDYKVYSSLFERDQQVFIRRMVTSALLAFKQLHNIH